MVNGISGTGSVNYLSQMSQSRARNSRLTPDQIFGTIDANGDGVISREELKKTRSGAGSTLNTLSANAQADPAAFLLGLLRDAGNADTASAATGAANAGSSSLKTGRLTSEQIFSTIDANGDGVISKEEFGRFQSDMFAKLAETGVYPQAGRAATLYDSLQATASGSASTLASVQQAAAQKVANVANNLGQILSKYAQLAKVSHIMGSTGRLTVTG
jgi:hypothetical protein